jgi:ABC-type Mn2+/Zn2+ transport system ATPase subunit
MIRAIPYKGNQWFKCDLHLHTTASKCFQDRTITPEQWIQKAIDQGLHCVAVTDHNTGEMIDAIKTAAADTGLIVFPGVEITCDTSKVHLLILFDVDKSSSDVNDFLIRCEIDRAAFADQLASTTLNIFQIAEKAHEHGAIVIPAHIDEYNGLGSISNDNLKSFFDLPYINAAQVVHEQFTQGSLQTNNNESLKVYLNDYYSNPSPAIDFTKMAEWHRPVKIAIEKKIAITTFSDNPHEPKNSKHGIDGIGSRFTWLKMDEYPTLEGLRQAFLLPEFRVKNDFLSPQTPYRTPDLWIKSISVTDTTITDGANPLVIDFSPQLTTIIGGRGSGKSSILRFIRGLFNRTADLKELAEIISDHHEFYKNHDQRTQKGVLKSASVIQIEFVRNKILHKITASGITSSVNQTLLIQKYDTISSTWVSEGAEGYIDFFQYEQYSQKQIYEIAQEPNSLRERIDKSITGLDAIKNEREVIKKTFLEKSASIRTIQQQISGKGRLKTEISDLDDRIGLYQQSGIAALLTSKEQFTSQKEIIDEFIEQAEQKENEIGTLIGSLDFTNVDYTTFEQSHADELSPLSQSVVDGYNLIKGSLENLKEQAETLRVNYLSGLETTVWNSDHSTNQADFDTKKAELEEQGIDDISNFEKLTEERATKEKELERIEGIETNLATETAERERLQGEYLRITKEITTKRKDFVATILHDDKVKVSINPFRNKVDFTVKIRQIIQRQGGFESDVDSLTSTCFSGNVEHGIKTVREKFLKIKKGEPVTGVTGYFIKLVSDMTDAQIDEIELLMPEDEIDVKYKPSGSTAFKPLSTASAGQKTTAILTFILSQGDIPLILDQPEDDLDNRLVYELIVDRLKQAKDHRQIIVVTHNANIPVNGDAEYILSMNSESKKLQILCSGTVEQSVVKKEICDVMEGSEQAFEMRSRRYKQIN